MSYFTDSMIWFFFSYFSIFEIEVCLTILEDWLESMLSYNEN